MSQVKLKVLQISSFSMDQIYFERFGPCTECDILQLWVERKKDSGALESFGSASGIAASGNSTKSLQEKQLIVLLESKYIFLQKSKRTSQTNKQTGEKKTSYKSPEWREFSRSGLPRGAAPFQL